VDWSSPVKGFSTLFQICGTAPWISPGSGNLIPDLGSTVVAQDGDGATRYAADSNGDVARNFANKILLGIVNAVCGGGMWSKNKYAAVDG
jgi:hypothetical protein